MLPLAPLVVALPLLGFWMGMFSHMTHNVTLSSDAKFMWTMAFVFMKVFGAVWYYAAEYRSGV